MKNTRAKQWERISEGLVPFSEIEQIQTNRYRPIRLEATRVDNPGSIYSIAIIRFGKKYDVYNNIDLSRTIPHTSGRVTKKPYKYLSCAVRRAIKEYKAALATYKWRMLSFYPTA